MIKKGSNPKSFICQICFRRFSRTYNLNRHARACHPESRKLDGTRVVTRKSTRYNKSSESTKHTQPSTSVLELLNASISRSFDQSSVSEHIYVAGDEDRSFTKKRLRVWMSSNILLDLTLSEQPKIPGSDFGRKITGFKLQISPDHPSVEKIIQHRDLTWFEYWKQEQSRF